MIMPRKKKKRKDSARVSMQKAPVKVITLNVKVQFLGLASCDCCNKVYQSVRIGGKIYKRAMLTTKNVFNNCDPKVH